MRTISLCLAAALATLLGCASGESVVCERPGQDAAFELPDDSPETYARLTVVRESPACGGDAARVSTLAVPPAVDGVVTVQCSAGAPCEGRAGAPRETIVFVLR